MQLASLRCSSVPVVQPVSRRRCLEPVRAVNSTAAPPIPADNRRRVNEFSDIWLQRCIQAPIKHPQSLTSLHLLGVCFFSPDAAKLVDKACRVLKPTVIALEQPSAVKSSVMLPYPEWIQVLLDRSRTAVDGSDQSLAYMLSNDPELQQQLSDCAVEARIGKDIIDPFENIGFYSGADFVVSPRQIVFSAKSLGFAPGCEFVAAANYAADAHAETFCIDAPLKLQEVWVKRMAEGFTVTSSHLKLQLLKEYELNESLLPETYLAWDRQLGSCFRDPEDAVIAFKASKALAASLVAPNDLPIVLQRLKQLQPLKFKLFDKRREYMLSQLKELHGRKMNDKDKSSPKQQVVLAIVGRQHVSQLQAALEDSCVVTPEAAKL